MEEISPLEAELIFLSQAIHDYAKDDGPGVV